MCDIHCKERHCRIRITLKAWYGAVLSLGEALFTPRPPRWAPVWSRLAELSRAGRGMRWDAAATVADRRFHSHIMDSNDPYLHLSKFFFSPLPRPFPHFLRFGWIWFCANRVCFMAIVRGAEQSGAVRCAEPPLRTLLSTGIQESGC